MKRKLITLIVSGIILYIGAYGIFRQTHIEVWEKNGKTYVIFPKNGLLLYHIFWPLSYIDGAITGMGFHIGPHQ